MEPYFILIYPKTYLGPLLISQLSSFQGTFAVMSVLELSQLCILTFNSVPNTRVTLATAIVYLVLPVVFLGTPVHE